jgi:hypothetical protein
LKFYSFYSSVLGRYAGSPSKVAIIPAT